jgi:hypothetical protein
MCWEIRIRWGFILVYEYYSDVINAWCLIPDRCVCRLSAARHVLCEKQGKINEAYKKLQDGWLDNGDKVPPAEFAKVSVRFMRACIYSSARN